MATGYSKEDVTQRVYGYRQPVINIKVYDWKYTPEQLMDDERVLDYTQAQAIIQSVYERHTAEFWDDVRWEVEQIFGRGYQVGSEGRSGGWLVVRGLSDVDEWDAVMLGKWRRLEAWCKAEIKELCSEERIKGTIEVERLVELATGVDEIVEVQ